MVAPGGNLWQEDATMSNVARLELDGKTHELPIVTGTEHERAINIARLRDQAGCITLDDGYRNTGSCESAVTFIDGDQGILRYRGIPIEELAEKSSFIETAFLLIYGHLPTSVELRRLSELLTQNEMLHEDMKFHFEGFPPNAHPMAILSAMINATSCFHPGLLEGYSPATFDVQAARLMSKVRTIAAFAYRKSLGLPIIYPKPVFKYTANFLHMMFSEPYVDYELKPEAVRALDLIFLLHADHEQNCSTSTVRMIASARANLFACAAGGVCALWGPRHGGANQEVLEMLQRIHDSGDDGSQFIAQVKDKKSGARLMGFGHAVYRNFDPRARIVKEQCDILLNRLHHGDPLLDVAKHLEAVALRDEYFLSRKLYPNVDFYSGIIMRALNIPVEMFTVIFAIGRMPGWIAHYKEVMDQQSRIYRPRQIYVGPAVQHYVPMDQRRAP
jgi:citrate synthase